MTDPLVKDIVVDNVSNLAKDFIVQTTVDNLVTDPLMKHIVIDSVSSLVAGSVGGVDAFTIIGNYLDNIEHQTSHN